MDVMKKYGVAILLMLGWSIPASVFAASPPVLGVPAGLSMAEIKITGSEFVMLQNNTGTTIPDLGKYWLYVFNNVNPLAAGVNSSSQQLPTGSLANGQFILLSASGGNTCGAAVTAKLSLSLNDSGGFLQVVQNNLSGGLLVQTAGDAVSWSSGINNAEGMISNVPSNSKAPNGMFYRYQNSGTDASFLWQQAEIDANNECQIKVVVSGVVAPVITGGLVVGGPPPVTIISIADESDEEALPEGALPPADVGLAAPQINELLPNPAEPQTDSEDEFIELYNSNDVQFDLTGFKLQTGTTTLHNFSFAAGTMLAPKSFTAFYSIDTNLSLSNTSGQAKLLDPAGNVISETEVYTKALDGQTWAFAEGKWYWTINPTANAANIINQPLSVKKLSVGTTKAATSTTKKSSSATKSSSAKKTVAPKVKGASTTADTSATIAPQKNSSPVHPLILAGVGAGAVAYAAYEYRNDLANRIYKLRRYAAARAAARPTDKKS